VGSNALFNRPYGVSVSSNGSYALVADEDSNLIRKIVLSIASVSSLAGLGSSSGSTNGVSSNALFNSPQGVSVSQDGSYALVADYSNHLIRQIIISTASVSTLAGLSPTSSPTSSSSKYSFGVVFGDPESQGLRVGSALLLDYFISFGDEGLNSFKL
jgi:DNA-binding beta-propeller fold protein YncE